MTTPTFSLSAANVNGDIKCTLGIFPDISYSAVKIHIDTGSGNQVEELSVTTDTTGDYPSTFLITKSNFSALQFGLTYHLYMVGILASNSHTITSTIAYVTTSTLPILDSRSNITVIPGNNTITLNLNSSLYTGATSFTGYSSLIGMLVICKNHSTNSTNASISQEFTGNNIFNAVIDSVSNNVSYDLDIYLLNINGIQQKALSIDTVTPIPTPGPVPTNLAAVANIVLNPTAGPGRTVLFNAPASAPLTGLNRIDSYSIVILDASSVQIGLPITCPTDASGNPVPTFCQYDSSRNIIQTRYLDVSYNYKWVDTSSDFSTRKYEVYAHNSYGDGAKSTTSLVQGCAVPGPPTIVVTPVVSDHSGSGSINVNVTDTLLNGLSVSSHKVKVWRTSDAIQNAVGGYNWSALNLNTSHNVILSSDISNGISYTVAVKTVTALGSTYFTSAQATGSCIPYALPATPAVPTITDVSGNIPLDGKLNISWASVSAYTVANGYGSDSSLNYQLIRADISNTPFDVQGLFYQDTGLTNGRLYSYTLRAYVWNNGTKVLSEASSPPVESRPFAAPGQVSTSTFSATVHPSTSTVSYRFVGLSSDPNHTIRYKAQVFNSSSVSASPEVDVSANFTNTFSYGSFSLGTTYTIKITPYVVDSGRTFDGPSTSASFIPYLVPGAPQTLDVVPSNGSFFCSWSNVPDLDTSSNVGGVHIISYSVQVLDANLTAIGLPVVSSNLYFSTTGLTNGIQYGVQVSPVGLIGNNVTTGDQTTFLQSSADNTSIIPSNTNVPAPIFLKYDSHNNSVTLNWLQLRTFNGTWNIYKDFVPLSNLTPSSRAATPDDVHGTAINNGNYTLWSVAIPNLTNGKPYTFIISAENSSGIGSNMSSTITAVSKTPPDPVTSVQFSSTTSSLTLSWTAPTSDGGAATAVGFGDDGLKYRINVYDITEMSGGVPSPTQGNSKSLNSTTLITNMPVNTSSTSATFSSSSYPGIKNGYTYASTIVAFVDYDYSFISNSGTVSGTFESLSTPVITRPMLVTSAAPEVFNLTAVAGNNSVTLNWSDPSQNVYVLGDHIISRSINGAAFSYLNTVPQSAAGANRAFTYPDNTVLNGNSYQYKVVLTNTTTAPPAGVQSSSVIPFGKPIFAAGNVSTTDYTNFTVTICKNGSVLTDYIAVGLVSDSSGDIIPVSMGTPSFTANALTTFNSATIAAGQAGTFSFTMTDDNKGGPNIVNVKDMLIIVGNAKGTTSVIWPSNSTAFSNGTRTA